MIFYKSINRKENSINQCLELLKKFIVLLTGIVSASNHTKCISLSNQKCAIEPTLVKLHPKEYSQEFNYFQFWVKIDSVLEAVIVLMTYLIKYLLQKKQKI